MWPPLLLWMPLALRSPLERGRGKAGPSHSSSSLSDLCLCWLLPGLLSGISVGCPWVGIDREQVLDLGLQSLVEAGKESWGSLST